MQPLFRESGQAAALGPSNDHCSDVRRFAAAGSGAAADHTFTVGDKGNRLGPTSAGAEVAGAATALIEHFSAIGCLDTHRAAPSTKALSESRSKESPDQSLDIPRT